jgi:hypothetical protein
VAEYARCMIGPKLSFASTRRRVCILAWKCRREPFERICERFRRTAIIALEHG